MKNLRRLWFFIILIITLITIVGCSSERFTVAVDYDNNQGEVSGLGEYEAGESATIIASTKEGYRFVGWYDGGILVDNNKEMTLIVKSDVLLEAKFSSNEYEISAQLDNVTGGNLEGLGIYSYGEKATIVAVPKDNYYFYSWEGIPEYVSVSGNTLEFIVESDLQIEARFKKDLSNKINFLSDNISGPLFPITEVDKRGLINLSGEVVALFDSETSLINVNTPYFRDGFEGSYPYIAKENIPLVFSIHGRIAFFNNKGDFLFDGDYHKLRIEKMDVDYNYNDYGLIAYKNNKYGFINYEGEAIIDFLYDDFRPISRNNEAEVIFKENSKYGVVNSKNGETILETEFDDIKLISQENGIYLSSKDRSKYLFNKEGNLIIDLDMEFNDIKLISQENGVYLASKGRSKYLLDRSGNLIKDLGEISIQSTCDSGIAVFSVFKEAMRFGLLDYTSGIKIVEPEYRAIRLGNDGYFFKKSDNKWEVMSKEGHLLTELKFDDIKPFRDGYAVFKKGNKKGLLDKQGEIAIKGSFKEINYHEGYFTYVKDSKIGIIVNGEIITEPVFDGYDIAFHYDTDGSLRAHNYVMFSKNDKWAFYDIAKSEFITDFLYRNESQVYSFDGIPQAWTVKYNQDTYKLINLLNGEVLTNKRYVFLVNKRIITKKNDKYGFLDENGSLVIEPKYDKVTQFANGVAGVKKNNKVAYIDVDGNYVIDPFEYDGRLSLTHFEDMDVFSGVGNLYFWKDGTVIYEAR